MYSIEEIIEPETIAIVGSARRNEFYFLRSLVAAGFKGAIYPVNPHVKSGMVSSSTRVYPKSQTR